MKAHFKTHQARFAFYEAGYVDIDQSAVTVSWLAWTGSQNILHIY